MSVDFTAIVYSKLINGTSNAILWQFGTCEAIENLENIYGVVVSGSKLIKKKKNNNNDTHL